LAGRYQCVVFAGIFMVLTTCRGFSSSSFKSRYNLSLGTSQWEHTNSRDSISDMKNASYRRQWAP
jgi:hypothetical protein